MHTQRNKYTVGMPYIIYQLSRCSPLCPSHCSTEHYTLCSCTKIKRVNSPKKVSLSLFGLCVFFHLKPDKRCSASEVSPSLHAGGTLWDWASRTPSQQNTVFLGGWFYWSGMVILSFVWTETDPPPQNTAASSETKGVYNITPLPSGPPPDRILVCFCASKEGCCAKHMLPIRL